MVAGHRHQQPGAALEVVVDELARDAAGGRDVGDRHRVDAALADEAPRRLEDVGARVALACWSLHLTRVKPSRIVHVSNATPGGGSHGVEQRVRADRDGRSHASTRRSRRRRATMRRPRGADRRAVGRHDHLRRARGPHRPRGGGARRRAACGPGDVLALWAPNSPEWAIAALGRHGGRRHGHRRSPVAVERELAGQLMDSRRSILVAVPARLPAAREVAATAGVREVVALGDVERRGPRRPRSRSIRRARSRCCPTRAARPGCPRACMLTHANLAVAVAQARAALKLGPRDTVVAVAPFAHVMGFVITLCTALTPGATRRHAAALRLRAVPRARRAPPGHRPHRRRRR